MNLIELKKVRKTELSLLLSVWIYNKRNRVNHIILLFFVSLYGRGAFFHLSYEAYSEDETDKLSFMVVTFAIFPQQ